MYQKMENLTINHRPTNHILTPFSLNTLAHYLYQSHVLNLQLNPDEYDLPLAKHITFENILEELTKNNTNRDALYEIIEDYLSGDRNPISQVILDLTL